MKKRIISFLLALVLVLGLIPAAATNANAASEWKTSAKAIDILKGSVTFYEKEQSNKIGYSTPADFILDGETVAKKYKNGISKEDATDLLRAYLKENVDAKINEFTKKNNIDLNQNEHDALAVHYFRMGGAATIFEAIRTIKTVNSASDRAAIVNAFMATRTHDCTSNEALKPTMDVSLAEAAMYLYGDYGYNGGNKLVFARLDKTGDMIGDSVVAFVKADGHKLNPLTGDFLGWFLYDAKKETITGAPLTKLTGDHHGKLIVAKQYTDDDGNGNTFASYTINTKTLIDKHIYDGSLAITDTILKNDTSFKVTYEYLDSNGDKWVFGKGTSTKDKAVSGWVKVGKMETPSNPTDKPISTAAITTNTLSIYAGATADSDVKGSLNKGDVVNIYETKVEKTDTGNKTWGKVMLDTDNDDIIDTIGWINLATCDVNETQGESGKPEGQSGKIANADDVNIRDEGAITGDKLTSLKRGTKVTVLEMNADRTWAKIKWTSPSNGYTQGWVYMHYVQLDSAYAGSGTSTPDTVKYTGVVTSNINLNVRKSADIYATKVDSLPNGTKINIYETKTSKNMKWGRIGDDRWVCLTYVSLTEVKQPAAGSSSTTTSTQATVTVATLDVLKNYNNNAEKVGSLKKGDVVTILEKNTESTGTGSRIWGRISKDGLAGWINLAYVELKTVTSVSGTTGSTGSTGSNANGANGVISDCISVNVREGAGVSNAQITKLNNGTAVKVYEQVTKDNAPWAKITWNNGANSGWVCMNYVTMVTGSTGTTTEGGLVNGTNSNTISATGIVNSNIDLNVRSVAGLDGIKLGSLKKGTKVTIYEQVSADGMIWGRIQYGNGNGWICMSYISIESASSTGKGVMGTIARCFAAVNVRSAPGTGNALINKIAVGTRVEVFETRQHGTQMWGRVAQGWICMDYVLLDSELPPGTVLDATVPTTAPTQAEKPEETVNRDGEIAFVIEAQTLKVLNVYNDTDMDSARVGTVKSGVYVDIRALKNNGGELWGRIDQYGTAGWILMDKTNVSYAFTRYVAVDEQPIYVDANTNSAVKATLGINTWLYIDKVTTDGTNVYAWVEDAFGEGIWGWIPMDKTCEKEVNVIKTYKNGDSVGLSGTITGTTFAAMDAVDSIGGSRVLFKMTSGVKVKIASIRVESGKIWGRVQYDSLGADSSEYGYAWINMSNVNFSVAGTVAAEMEVRNSMDDSNDENIVTTIAAGTEVKLCQFSFDSYGNLWARLNGNVGSGVDTNGEFIMVCAYSANGEPGTVYVNTVVSY